MFFQSLHYTCFFGAICRLEVPRVAQVDLAFWTFQTLAKKMRRAKSMLSYTQWEMRQMIYYYSSLTDANRKKYDPVKTKLEEHFIIKCNVIFEIIFWDLWIILLQTCIDLLNIVILVIARWIDTWSYSYGHKRQSLGREITARSFNWLSKVQLIKSDRRKLPENSKLYLKLRGIPQAKLMWIMLTWKQSRN